MSQYLDIFLVVAFLILLNFAANYFLKRNNRGDVVKKTCLQALFKPLMVFVWIFAAIKILNLLFKGIPEEHLIFAIAFILCAAWFFLRWKNLALHDLSKDTSYAEKNKLDMIGKMITVVILFLTIFMLLEALGLSLNTLIAFGGVGGLAIAFASQQVIANFFGGFMIYATHPFTIGDWVKLPEKDIEGHVEEIGWYMTLIRTLDKVPVYVPNSIFSSLVVMTPSRMSHRKIDEILSLSYDDLPRIPSVIKAIESYLVSHPDVDETLKVNVHFSSYAAHSLDIKVVCYLLNTDGFAFDHNKEAILLELGKIVESQGASFSTPTNQIKFLNELIIP